MGGCGGLGGPMPFFLRNCHAINPPEIVWIDIGSKMFISMSLLAYLMLTRYISCRLATLIKPANANIFRV